MVNVELTDSLVGLVKDRCIEANPSLTHRDIVVTRAEIVAIVGETVTIRFHLSSGSSLYVGAASVQMDVTDRIIVQRLAAICVELSKHLTLSLEPAS